MKTLGQIDNKEAIRAIFKILNNQALTDGQARYFESVKRYYRKYKRVSDKQLKILSEMMKNKA